MLAEQFHAAAAAAKTTVAVDEIARLTWRAHAEGHILDAEAEAISEALHGRRAAFAARGTQRAVSPSIALSARRRPAPRSPDRQASLERRRRQAMSGAVPAKIATGFTTAENAVLSVIARQVQRSGTCSLPIDAIAALAGVSRTTAQNALRQARCFGLIEVRERRRRGLPSLTNVVKVISKEWSAWLKLSGQGIGFKNLNATNSLFSPRGEPGDKSSSKRGAHWRNGARSCYVPSTKWRGREAAE